MIRRVLYVAGIAIVLVAILAGKQTNKAAVPAAFSAAGASTPAQAKTARSGDPGAEIKIDNFTFTPAALTVAVGTEVTWTNRDDIPHTVVTDDKAVKSKVLDTDEKFTYTFTKPGTYSYFCSLHPKMKGTIVVQ
jgi:plastocyanin